jgi:predicted ribosome quality control (RQC) complex YloA/Tae2 family protein
VKLVLSQKLSANENAQEYFSAAKNMRARIAELEKEILVLKKRISEEEHKQASAEKARENKALPQKRAWFEEFHWFKTSSGFLVVGGKNADQNELLVRKHLQDSDLFFHANFHGAPATVFKTDGKSLGEIPKQDLLEAAQFAVCYSGAWKQGFHSCDAYFVLPNQVSKHSHGEYVGKGGFVISGERNWFKGLELKLSFAVDSGKTISLPFSKLGFEKRANVVPGQYERRFIAQKVCRRISAREEDIMKLLPGNSEPA